MDDMTPSQETEAIGKELRAWMHHKLTVDHVSVRPLYAALLVELARAVVLFEREQPSFINDTADVFKKTAEWMKHGDVH